MEKLTKEDLIRYIIKLENSNWEFMEERVLEAEIAWSKLLEKSNKKLSKYRKEVFKLRKLI